MARYSAYLAVLATIMVLPWGCGDDHDHGDDGHSHNSHSHNSHSHNSHSHNDATKAGETQFEGMSANGLYHVHWTSTPNPLPLNEQFSMNVTVHKGDHSATMTDATLLVDATMPQHGHGMNTTPSVMANGDGTFTVEGMLFHMEGDWQLAFTVGGPDGNDMAMLNVSCCQ